MIHHLNHRLTIHSALDPVDRTLLHVIQSFPLGMSVNPEWAYDKTPMYMPIPFFDLYANSMNLGHRWQVKLIEVDDIKWHGDMLHFMESKNLVLHRDFLVSYCWVNKPNSQYYWFGISFLDDEHGVEYKLRFGEYEQKD